MIGYLVIEVVEGPADIDVTAVYTTGSIGQWGQIQQPPAIDVERITGVLVRQ